MVKRLCLNILLDIEMKLNGYVKYFDNNNNKFINLLVRDEEQLKNTINFEKKIKIYLKESLIVTQQIIINTLILK